MAINKSSGLIKEHSQKDFIEFKSTYTIIIQFIASNPFPIIRFHYKIW